MKSSITSWRWPFFWAFVVMILAIVGSWWCITQPVWIFSDARVDVSRWKDLPATNKDLLTWVEQNGRAIAPSYRQVVCTEFVIGAVQHVMPLTRREKNDVRIITEGNLEEQIMEERPIIRGVQTALVAGKKGVEVAAEDVQPGDLVQFWTIYCGKAFGHCGIVLDINPGKTLTLYSSHPVTGGYGKQMYLWPKYSYFVRLSEH